MEQGFDSMSIRCPPLPSVNLPFSHSLFSFSLFSSCDEGYGPNNVSESNHGYLGLTVGEENLNEKGESKDVKEKEREPAGAELSATWLIRNKGELTVGTPMSGLMRNISPYCEFRVGVRGSLDQEQGTTETKGILASEIVATNVGQEKKSAIPCTGE